MKWRKIMWHAAAGIGNNGSSAGVAWRNGVKAAKIAA